MATWLTHTRVCDAVSRRLFIPDPLMFAAGSIAPDTGTRSPDGFSYTPPRRILHRTSPDGRTIFYGDFAAEYIHEGLDGSALSFYFGCYAHLMLDDIWARKVYLPLRRRYESEITASNRAFIWRIKKSWYDLDREYLRDHTVTSFELLKSCVGIKEQYLDYVTPDMLNSKLNELRVLYSDLSFTPDPDYVFITRRQLDDVISYTAELLEKSVPARCLHE